MSMPSERSDDRSGDGPALRIVPTESEPVDAVAGYETLLQIAAERLTSIRRDMEGRRDDYSWAMATEYNAHFTRLRETAKAEGRVATPQAINRDIRRIPGYGGPGPSWLSNAKKTHEVFQDVFYSKVKKLAYWHYMLIATSRIEDKESLRRWAEETEPTQAVLRERIAREVSPSRYSPILKPSDNWNFNPMVYSRIDDESGHGYIPGDLYVNCFWYFVLPGQVAVDLMAGSGMAWHVYEDRANWMPADDAYEFDLRLFDLSPRGRYADRIVAHDAREPLPLEHANYIFADVPYFGMARGQYGDRPEDLANQDLGEYLRSIVAIARNCAAVQSNDDLVTVVSPNHSDLSIGNYVMIDQEIIGAFIAAGYHLYHRACSSRYIQRMQAPTMACLNNRAKACRIMLTDISYVLTFVRDSWNQ